MFAKVFEKQLFLSVFLVLVFQKCDAAIVSPYETTLVFYYGPEFSNATVYELSDATKILENPNFNKNETHLYIHGFKELQDSESTRVIVGSYFKRNNVNIVTLDWAKAAGEGYLSALSNAQALATVLADAIISLYKAGIDRESLTVVAHSLGAQLAGFTGRKMIQKSNGTMKIYR